jgi:hypothetical protein
MQAEQTAEEEKEEEEEEEVNMTEEDDDKGSQASLVEAHQRQLLQTAQRSEAVEEQQEQ